MNKPSAQPTTIVRCPECQASVAWTPSNTYRPFCSKRCKLLDLGAWANESHQIKGDPIDNEDLYETHEE